MARGNELVTARPMYALNNPSRTAHMAKDNRILDHNVEGIIGLSERRM